MKKTLALILTLALSLAALTGCGSKTETPADTNTCLLYTSPSPRD